MLLVIHPTRSQLFNLYRIFNNSIPTRKSFADVHKNPIKFLDETRVEITKRNDAKTLPTLVYKDSSNTTHLELDWPNNIKTILVKKNRLNFLRKGIENETAGYHRHICAFQLGKDAFLKDENVFCLKKKHFFFIILSNFSNVHSYWFFAKKNL